MLYSHNLEDEKINLFLLFLDKAQQAEEKYAQIVNDVILDARDYASGLKSVYNLKRDTLNIVLKLVHTENDFFKTVEEDPGKYNSQLYSKVAEILAQHNHQLAV